NCHLFTAEYAESAEKAPPFLCALCALCVLCGECLRERLFLAGSKYQCYRRRRLPKSWRGPTCDLWRAGNVAVSRRGTSPQEAAAPQGTANPSGQATRPPAAPQDARRLSGPFIPFTSPLSAGANP